MRDSDTGISDEARWNEADQAVQFSVTVGEAKIPRFCLLGLKGHEPCRSQ
jgi:hypothetical protein